MGDGRGPGPPAVLQGRAAGSPAAAGAVGPNYSPSCSLYGPAAVAGLTDRGAIAEGKKADFVVWSDEAKALTSREDNFHRHKVSPYADQDMVGKVEATFVSGHLVFSKGEATGDVCGRILRL